MTATSGLGPYTHDPSLILPPVCLEPSTPLRIGLCELGGPDGASDVFGIRRGAELACTEMQKLIDRPIELVTVEETSDPRDALQAVAYLASREVVAVVGPLTYSAATVLLPFLSRVGMCMLVPSIRNADLTRKQYPGLFRIDFDSGAQVVTQADFIRTSLRTQKLIIIHSLSPFWAKLALLMHEEFPGTGRLPLQFWPGFWEFRQMADDLNRAGPEALFLSADEQDLLHLIPALRAGGVRAPIIACAALRPASVGMLASAEDLYLTEWWSPIGTYERLADPYRLAYQCEPGFYSPEAFDSVVCVAAAVSKIKLDTARWRGTQQVLDITWFEMREALHALCIDSITGHLEFDEKGDRKEQGSVRVVAAHEFDLKAVESLAHGGEPVVDDTSAGLRPRPSPVEIFISYSARDSYYCDKLIVHLSRLQRDGIISAFQFREIPAGTKWKAAIDEHMESAQVFLMLASPEFLYSDYCYSIELKRALSRMETGTAVVIPVILRHCDWKQTPLGDLQALPEGGRPIKNWRDKDEAFESVRAGVEQTVRNLAAKPGGTRT